MEKFCVIFLRFVLFVLPLLLLAFFLCSVCFGAKREPPRYRVSPTNCVVRIDGTNCYVRYMYDTLLNELEKRNITRHKLAKMSGIESSYMYDCLSGKRNMGDTCKRRICEALDMDYSELFGDEVFELRERGAAFARTANRNLQQMGEIIERLSVKVQEQEEAINGMHETIRTLIEINRSIHEGYRYDR